MGTIIAINASPRTKWNTARLVREAAEGAVDAGNVAEVIDLYELEPFMGCRSCFACKTERFLGKCVYRDGLTETLQKIREANGLIVGTPNYLGRPTAGFRALYERLIFQDITYRQEVSSYNSRRIPVLFIMTSNAPVEWYEKIGYDAMLSEYSGSLESKVGPTTVFTCGDTLQTDHYERYDWSYFDVEAKQGRRAEVFPQELDRVRKIAADLF